MPVRVPIFGEPRAIREFVRRAPSEAFRFVAGETAGGTPPVCAAVERFPEEWPAGRVRTLLDRFPLSAWVVACGPWAAGGGRTGSPWPAALRCRDAEAAVRIAAAVRGERVPTLLGGENPAPTPPPGVGPVRVFSPDRVWRETTARLLSGDDGPRWEVWDSDAWDERREAALTRSRLREPGTVRVGLAGFPLSARGPSRRHASGLDRVLSKWDDPRVVWGAVQSAAFASASPAGSGVRS